MARKPADDFFDRVFDVLARIPLGRVTTYGHIAAHLGSKKPLEPWAGPCGPPQATDCPVIG